MRPGLGGLPVELQNIGMVNPILLTVALDATLGLDVDFVGGEFMSLYLNLD